ncbi:hypothetical protein [Botrimarina hoheduenensis]|uniref:Uncharacterized protein n=1 Tax=Botrimarina hoheduenensis TaxID=2528000 RepID=A0A5C5WEM9_9BACT|nr:hypothetical protein [Botrimarina hoheduenensis]TWT48957.1 hypothetical protein Pla111_07350 [Botrimarina hoheduenensis]
MAKNSPEATFRLGSVSATVFVQETGSGDDKRSFRTVNLQRSYRDGDQTKYSGSFTAADLPAAIRTMQLAQQHVERQDVLAAE